MKNKEEIRSAGWYPKTKETVRDMLLMDEGDIIQKQKKQIKDLENVAKLLRLRVKELEDELQSIAEDAAGEDL